MDFLARREHSFYELIQKLVKKFPANDREMIITVLETLRSENLQSDERFTESYVRYRSGKGFGYLHIRADLLSRRVNDSLVAEYLDAIDDWDDTVQRLIAKKLRIETNVVFGSKIHRKILKFLESRGFTPAQIRKGLEPWLVF